MDVIILIAAAVVLAVIGVVLHFVIKSNKKEKVVPRQRQPQDAARNAAPRRAQMARNRGARLRANVAHQDRHGSDEDNEEEREEIEVPEGAKIGAKKRAKLEAKAEKKAAREAEEQLRAEKKKKADLAEEERKKQEEKERLEEKRLEEEQRRLKEEQERREHEEYLKMKEAFTVEEEGYEAGEQEDGENLLQKFVNYIKTNKVVIIEDLAAHFKLKTQAAIDRIKDLQNDNILTGVIDDRGKYIYVSPEEMEAVAKFIRQRGRVSITELAENSNKLINLTPSASVNS